MRDVDDGLPEKMNLRERALELRELASQVRVMVGTLAERDLERSRAGLEETILTIECANDPDSAIADRLRGIAIMIESALYMGGINASGAPSVTELQLRLGDWFERR